MHADTIQFVVDNQVDLGQGNARVQIDLPKARAGGLDALFFSIWVDPKLYPGERGVTRAFRLIEALQEQARRHAAAMALVTTPAGLEEAVKQGKLAALMGVEGGHALNGQLDNLQKFYDAGVRYLTLTWSNTNELGDSSGDLKSPVVKHHGGLTEFGRQAIEMMNRLGMMVDISHVSDETFYDTLKVTKHPVIASHSNARALGRHPRNMTDEMLRAVAQNGGVICVNFYPLFLDNAYVPRHQEVQAGLKVRFEAINQAYADDPVRAAYERDWLLREALQQAETVSYERIVDHIEHMIQVAGIDHVGLGSDFDGIPSTPAGMRSAADLPKLTSELRRRGRSDEEIRKILGGNVMRVFAAVSGQP